MANFLNFFVFSSSATNQAFKSLQKETLGKIVFLRVVAFIYIKKNSQTILCGTLTFGINDFPNYRKNDFHKQLSLYMNTRLNFTHKRGTTVFFLLYEKKTKISTKYFSYFYEILSNY